MQIRKSLCIAAGLAVSLFEPTLVAQAGIVSFSGGGAVRGGITGEPYTATLKTTRVQTLADGTKITHTTVVKQARDSAGKTYRETRMELPEGSGNYVANVFIFDPVNRETIFWNTRVKQATIVHTPDPQQIRSDAAPAPRVQATVQPPKAASDPAFHVEDLGTQTVNGVTAGGRRITRVIPAGKEGNDQPITVTTETWNSNELKLLVRRVDDDPRSGLTTMELTDLQQGEPDPALFQPPEGYTVKEQFPGQNQN
jgi:hypothetical protein